MSSLIPKVKIGLDLAFRGRNVSAMTHGTSEIGYVYPTYCRTYISKAKVSISPRTGVRFSPLFVPTMGKLNVRHYFDFVPYNRVYAPFDAFLAHEPYSFTNGSRVPLKLPTFYMNEIFQSYLMTGSASHLPSDIVNATDEGLRKYLTASLYIKQDNGDLVPASFNLETDDALWTAMYRSSGLPFQEGWNAIVPAWLVCRAAENPVYYTTGYDYSNTGNPIYEFSFVNHPNNKVKEFFNNLSFPSLEDCDWSYQFSYNNHVYFAVFNFNGAIKRLRSMFLGLGYSFNPYDSLGDSLLKLLAYYRSYYNHFGITRDSNFNDTFCARLTRYLNSTYTVYVGVDNGDGEPSQLNTLFSGFLKELIDLPYVCPPDYFSSAMQNAYANNPGKISDAYTEGAQSVSNNGVVPTSDAPWALRMANIMLRRVNVNNVVGRKIYDKLRSIYGDISVDDDSTEGNIRLGSDNVPIEIGAIFNQSSAGDMPLGGFAGVATGGKKSQSFRFETPSQGCLICMTAVVPEMGYFQGKLKENSDGCGDYYEFWNPDYDAVGWQDVYYNELVADRCYRQSGLPSGTNLGIYGKQPRYTHLKVGFNRVLGDISLPHMANSMLPYTLDRYFDPRSATLPVNSPTYSRRGDIGNTNRIFTVVSPTDDHIIYQIYFDVKVADSMKPIQDSYDTFRSGDTKAVEVSHE